MKLNYKKNKLKFISLIVLIITSLYFPFYKNKTIQTKIAALLLSGWGFIIMYSLIYLITGKDNKFLKVFIRHKFGIFLIQGYILNFRNKIFLNIFNFIYLLNFASYCVILKDDTKYNYKDFQNLFYKFFIRNIAVNLFVDLPEPVRNNKLFKFIFRTSNENKSILFNIPRNEQKYLYRVAAGAWQLSKEEQQGVDGISFQRTLPLALGQIALYELTSAGIFSYLVPFIKKKLDNKK